MCSMDWSRVGFGLLKGKGRGPLAGETHPPPSLLFWYSSSLSFIAVIFMSPLHLIAFEERG